MATKRKTPKFKTRKNTIECCTENVFFLVAVTQQSAAPFWDAIRHEHSSGRSTRSPKMKRKQGTREPASQTRSRLKHFRTCPKGSRSLIRADGVSLPAPFEGLITADRKVLNLENESRNDQGYAVTVRNALSHRKASMDVRREYS